MNSGSPAPDSAAQSTATRHRGAIRGFLYGLFFSTERRYQMFQTIVGGTIANLAAAGIIAGIAVAAGALTISFDWSWSSYWNSFQDAAAPVGLSVVGAFLTNLPGARERPGGVRRLLLTSLGFGVVFLFGSPLVINFFVAINLSLHHVNSG